MRLGISLVPEGRRIFDRLTVEENLVLGTFLRKGNGDSRSELRNVIELFPFLNERLSSPAGKLSGGEQQLLAIARALLTRPRLLLVDEPSLGLAPKLVELVYQTLLSLRDRGLTLLIVEQSLERVLEVADRIYVMREGIVQMSGPDRGIAGRRSIGRSIFRV